MTDLRENFIKLREDLELTAEEKLAMRSVLVARMSESAKEVTVESPYLRYFMQPMASFATFALLIVVAAGGTSALAADAIPGDTLYGVKVSVNERLERSFASSPVAKAEVDIKHAEERLEEIELLAAKGEEDSIALEKASLAVAAKVQTAAATADTFSDDGDEATADAIHSRLNAALLAHADILDAQAEGMDEDRKRGLRALSVAVAVAIDDVDDDRSDMDGNNVETIAKVALGREALVERNLKQLNRALSDKSLPQEIVIELDAQLASIQADYGDARELSVEKNYRAASAAYEDISRRISRSLAIVESAKRIEEKTGKEVLVSFETAPVAIEAADMMMAKSAPATMMMSVEATTTEEVANQVSERPFQFLVRDR